MALARPSDVLQARPVNDLSDHELVSRCWDLEAYITFADFALRWKAAAISNGSYSEHGERRE